MERGLPACSGSCVCVCVCVCTHICIKRHTVVAMGHKGRGMIRMKKYLNWSKKTAIDYMFDSFPILKLKSFSPDVMELGGGDFGM